MPLAGPSGDSAGLKDFHEHWERLLGSEAFRLLLSVKEELERLKIAFSPPSMRCVA